MIENRKVKHDYFIEETLECGIALMGNEVKSIRDGKASIKEAWVDIVDGNLIMKQMYVSPWNASNQFDIDELRNRRLLAHKKEIRDLSKLQQLQGYTLIPLKIYFTNGKAKVEVGVCKGKNNYDKRQVEKDRQMKRDIDRYQK